MIRGARRRRRRSRGGGGGHLQGRHQSARVSHVQDGSSLVQSDVAYHRRNHFRRPDGFQRSSVELGDIPILVGIVDDLIVRRDGDATGDDPTCVRGGDRREIGVHTKKFRSGARSIDEGTHWIAAQGGWSAA